MKNIIDEKTRVSLTTSNFWAILVALFLIGISWSNHTNRLSLIEQRQVDMLAQFKELNNNLKVRRAFNDETRNKVIVLETEVAQLRER